MAIVFTASLSSLVCTCEWDHFLAAGEGSSGTPVFGKLHEDYRNALWVSPCNIPLQCLHSNGGLYLTTSLLAIVLCMNKHGYLIHVVLIYTQCTCI